MTQEEWQKYSASQIKQMCHNMSTMHIQVNGIGFDGVNWIKVDIDRILQT